MDKIIVYYVTRNSTSFPSGLGTLISGPNIENYQVHVGYLKEYAGADVFSIYYLEQQNDPSKPGDVNIVEKNVGKGSVYYWSLDKAKAVAKCKELNKENKTKINNTLQFIKTYSAAVEDVEASKRNLTRGNEALSEMSKLITVYASLRTELSTPENSYFSSMTFDYYKYMKCYLYSYVSDMDPANEKVAQVVYNSEVQGDYVEQVYNPVFITTDLKLLSQAFVESENLNKLYSLGK